MIAIVKNAFFRFNSSYFNLVSNSFLLKPIKYKIKKAYILTESAFLFVSLFYSYRIIPAATVSFVASSTRMIEPVTLLTV